MTTPTVELPHWEGFAQQITTEYEKLPPNVPARTMRAIYHAHSPDPLEFLGDRMADRGDVKKLCAWLRKHHNRIQQEFYEAGLPSSDTRWVEYDADGGHFHGTPNASYGYCYCVAWLDPEPEKQS